MKKIFYFILISQITSAQLATDINTDLLKNKWAASWISHPQATKNGYEVLNFRKTFELSAKPDKYIIHISADNRYWLFVNGQRICTGPAKGDVSHWRFESLDIAPYLKLGKNLIAAMVWNHGAYMALWQMSHQTGLVIQGNSVKEAIVNTDTSWKVIRNNAYVPLSEDFRYIGARELFFAEKYPFGWEHTTFVDKFWVNAIITEQAVPAGVLSDNQRKLVPRNIPLPEETMQRFGAIRRMEGVDFNENIIKGTGNLAIYPWGNVKILIDQKFLTTAYPELLISGGLGAKITITYMEAPFINIKNENKGNRNDVDGKIIHGIYDIVLPDGGEKRTFRPLYYRTFRYVELKIENHLQPLIVHDFYSKFTSYPFKEKAAFSSNDTSLTAIWNTSWRTAKLCAYETYMDCPYYEQLQYIGDTRIQALVSLYVSGDEKLMKNAISQFNDSRIGEGITLSRYPNTKNQTQIIPPFSLFWTIMVHDYWMHRTDDTYVKSQLEGIREVLEWFASNIDPASGMLGKLPHWNFVDWPKEWPWTGSEKGSGMPKNSDNGGSSIHTLQFVYALEKAAQLFDAYNMNTEAVKYNQLASKLKIASYKICWDADKKMVADLPTKANFSQHANVMAVLTDAIQGADAKNLMLRIVTDTSIVQCTVYYRFYLNQAMKKVGLGDNYIPMLTPWRDMLKIGLTTFAEKPEPARSDCHGWSASPNYDLLATVLGVEPNSAGFKTVRIAPNLGKLKYVEGKIPHPNGIIEIKLKKIAKKGIEGNITLPLGITGIFVWNNMEVKLKNGVQFVKLM